MSSTSQTQTTLVADASEVQKNVARLRLVGGSPTEAAKSYKYAAYLPVWEHTTFPDWERDDNYVDPGSRATPDKRNLLKEGVVSKPITPVFGEEITGVQLSQLTKEGLDDLALLAAERGVLVFRDQDFKDIGIKKQLDIVRHFGRLHIHPTMGYPEGHPELHVVYRDPEDSTQKRYTQPNQVQSLTSSQFHIDHTPEVNPPGITFFAALETPEAGGDTLFVSTTEIYRRLSDEFKSRLEGLQIVHSNADMLAHSKSLGGPARFNPSTRTHPLIRTHPVTGEKILYFQRPGGHLKRVDNFKKEESEYLLEFLSQVLERSADAQLRARYTPGTVVVWDNRVVAHTALYDFKGDEKRHMIRIAALADVPK